MVLRKLFFPLYRNCGARKPGSLTGLQELFRRLKGMADLSPFRPKFLYVPHQKRNSLKLDAKFSIFIQSPTQGQWHHLHECMPMFFNPN